MKRRSRPSARVPGEPRDTIHKYTIGVVSELLGLPPHMLRRYGGELEKAGLLEPARQSGKNRLYSDSDLAILEEVAELYEQGVNAVGIRYIMQIRRHVRVLQQEIQEAREAQIRAENALREMRRLFDVLGLGEVGEGSGVRIEVRRAVSEQAGVGEQRSLQETAAGQADTEGQSSQPLARIRLSQAGQHAAETDSTGRTVGSESARE
ncbi:MerR family transcriptional regulator [Thermogemmatispora carboxidivorans]|uniref:MerR family transcriptional regulator n=1 Tax=Thermogemmatispora carboxidivorans TaxID=1382306 RepID=UPI0009E08F36|nr:MerR family transcriptional regulator [Thermogemmatispora carboxidivorans]